MITHPQKVEDMRERATLLNDMEQDLLAGRTKTAQALGWYTNWLAQKIKKHDYSKDFPTENYSPQ